MKNMKSVGLVFLITAFFAALVAPAPGIAQSQSVEELIALADKIQNENPAVGFEIATDYSSYAIGKEVAFRFKAEQDCYLSLIDIGTSGKTIVLFPNKWQTDNKVEKDKEYSIPPAGSQYAYKVVGPTGTERIKAIVSLEPFMANVQSLQEELKTPVGTGSESGGAFLTMKNPRMVLKDIAMEASKIDRSKWSALELKFEVAQGADDQGSKPPTQSEGEKDK